MAYGLGHLAYGVWLIAYGYLPQCPVESVDSLTRRLTICFHLVKLVLGNVTAAWKISNPLKRKAMP